LCGGGSGRSQDGDKSGSREDVETHDGITSWSDMDWRLKSGADEVLSWFHKAQSFAGRTGGGARLLVTRDAGVIQSMGLPGW
jgi:hypothetical protein